MPIDTVDFQPETAVDFQPDTGVDFQVEETPPSLQPVTAIPRQAPPPVPPQEQQRQAAFGIEPAPELKDLTFDEFKQLAGEMLTTGLINTPKFTVNPEDSFLVSAGKSVFNEIASVPEFMSSPLGAGTMAAGGAGMVQVGKALIPASRIVATAFAADTYYNLRKNLIETMPHLLKMSESELGEFVGRTAASGLLLGGLIRGAVGKAGAPVKAEAPVEQAAKQAEAAGLPATAEEIRRQPDVEAVAEPTALTPQPIGPGVSPIPEPVFGPPATPARGEGGGPPPTRVESGVPVEATTPAVTGPPAEGSAGPAIRPTTTEVAPSQAEAKPAAPAAEPTEVTSASEIEGPVGMVGRPRTGVAPQVAEGGPAEVQPAPGTEGTAGAPLQGGERTPVVAGGAQGEVRGEVGKPKQADLSNPAEPKPAEASPEEPRGVKNPEIAAAEAELRDAWEQYKGKSSGSVGPQRAPHEEMRFYRALVNLAKTYIKAGYDVMADWIQEAGLRPTEAVQRAWREAMGESPTVATLDGLTPEERRSLGNSGVQIALPPVRQAVAKGIPMTAPGPQPPPPAPGTPMPQPNPAAPPVVPNQPQTFPPRFRGVQQAASAFRQQRTYNAVRDQLSWEKDAGSNEAYLSAEADAGAIRRSLRRSLTGMSFKGTEERVASILKPWSNRMELAENALTFVIESGVPNSAGRTGEFRLGEFQSAILASPYANTKWGKRALSAIEFARQHYPQLRKIADEYNRRTDEQQSRENQWGLKTRRLPGYVMHLQELVDPWLGGVRDLMNWFSRQGESRTFFRERVHPTFADSIASGLDPRTLNSLDLLQKRLATGRMMIAGKMWELSLRGTADPVSGQPIITSTITKMTRTGTPEVTAPPGYRTVRMGNRQVAILNAYEPTISKLIDPNSWDGLLWDTLLKTAITGKHGMLLFDTYHLGRLAYHSFFLQNFAGAGVHNPLAYRRGLSLATMTEGEIRRLAAQGELPQSWLPRLHEDLRIRDGLVKHGLNISSISDALYSDWAQEIPVTGAFTRFLFREYQRGATLNSALIQFKRLQRQNPNMPEGELFRLVARDINYRYGNLRSQGLIKSRKVLDLARLVFLAPQWNEGLIRSELGAISETGRAAWDLAHLRKPVYGTLMRQVATITVAQFLANQAINYITRGHSTLENPEEGQKLSAFIPDVVGHGKGYFLNPVTLPMEISHLLLKNFEREYEKRPQVWAAAANALGRVAFTRLGYLPRAMAAATLSIDPFGNKIPPSKYVEKVGETAVPLPIASRQYYRTVSSLVQGAQVAEEVPGETQRQIMQSFGVRTENVPTATRQVSQLVMRWLRDHPDAKFREKWRVMVDSDTTSVYSALRSRLAANNYEAAAEEYANLRATGHDQSAINAAMSPKKTFAGLSKSAYGQFMDSLKPDEEALVEKAREEREELYRRFNELLDRIADAE